MKRSYLYHPALNTAALLLGLALSASAQAQEMARVVSSTPVIQQVAVPRQICSNSTVYSAAPKSGAGALMGAIAGGVIGNQIGGGSGKAVATVAGVLGGAMLGDRIEGPQGTLAQPVSSCTQQTSYENRIVAYNVTYEYAGRQYSTQMQNDPGSSLPIQIGPAVNSSSQVISTPPPPASVVTTYPPVIYAPPIYAPPIYGGPVYGVRSYPAPFYNPGINFQWNGGYNGYRGHHHRHWD